MGSAEAVFALHEVGHEDEIYCTQDSENDGRGEIIELGDIAFGIEAHSASSKSLSGYIFTHLDHTGETVSDDVVALVGDPRKVAGFDQLTDKNQDRFMRMYGCWQPHGMPKGKNIVTKKKPATSKARVLKRKTIDELLDDPNDLDFAPPRRAGQPTATAARTRLNWVPDKKKTRTVSNGDGNRGGSGGSVVSGPRRGRNDNDDDDDGYAVAQAYETLLRKRNAELEALRRELAQARQARPTLSPPSKDAGWEPTRRCRNSLQPVVVNIRALTSQLLLDVNGPEPGFAEPAGDNCWNAYFAVSHGSKRIFASDSPMSQPRHSRARYQYYKQEFADQGGCEDHQQQYGEQGGSGYNEQQYGDEASSKYSKYGYQVGRSGVGGGSSAQNAAGSEGVREGGGDADLYDWYRSHGYDNNQNAVSDDEGADVVKGGKAQNHDSDRDIEAGGFVREHGNLHLSLELAPGGAVDSVTGTRKKISTTIEGTNTKGYGEDGVGEGGQQEFGDEECSGSQ